MSQHFVEWFTIKVDQEENEKAPSKACLFRAIFKYCSVCDSERQGSSRDISFSFISMSQNIIEGFSPRFTYADHEKL